MTPVTPQTQSDRSTSTLWAAGVMPWLLLAQADGAGNQSMCPLCGQGMEGMPFVGWLMMALVGFALLLP